MIFADQTPVPIIIIEIVILICLGVGALYFFRGYEHFARRSLKRRYNDLEIHSDPQPEDVILSYHTYHGFLAWFTQTPHHVALPPKDARKLLGRLLRFNLMWSLVTLGAIFIPPLAILNYFAQRRSITAQEANNGLSASITEPTDTPLDSSHNTVDIATAKSPSLFHQFFGWIMVGLCILFGIVVFMCLVNGEFDTAIGGVVITAGLGWIARDWLSKGKTNTE